MPQDMTAKQTGFVSRYSGQIQQLLSIADQLSLANKEFADMAYGTGGANALTDEIVQTVLPHSTATLFNSGQASSITILEAIEQVRSSLEYMR